MINWIKYDDANNLDYALFEKENKSKYVYFDHRGQITFTPNILTTHFALKSEYLSILPKEA